MPYGPIPARLATAVAQQRTLSAMWDGECAGKSLHIARRDVGGPITYAGRETQPPELVRGWDGACEDCGTPIPWDDDGVRVGGGVHTVYDTPSGQLEPGCLYWGDWLDEHGCFYGWTNCEGRHLMAVLPNGHHWDIDSRASNCGSPGDTEHRCWVRHGEPPAVHVDKNGRTCSAGAGSIVGGDYHGFLHDGVFTAG